MTYTRDDRSELARMTDPAWSLAEVYRDYPAWDHAGMREADYEGWRQ